MLLVKNYLTIANYISLPDSIDNVLSLFVLAIFVCSMLKKSFRVIELSVYVILAVLSLHTGYTTGYMVLTASVLSIIAVKGEDIYSIAQKTFAVQFVLLIFNTLLSIMLYLTGIGNGYLWYYAEAENRLRICLGYGMAGHLADCILNMMILWIFIHYNHISLKNYIVLILLSFVSYIVTDSRVVFCVSFFMIIATYVSTRNRKWDGVIRFFTGIIVPLCTAVMIFSVKQYETGNSFGYLMDKILNSRVRNCGYNMEMHGITFLGQKCQNEFESFTHMSLKWSSQGITYDNLYMWFIINLGIIWLLFMILIMFKVAKNCSIFVCIMMISWALGAMIDTDFINSTRCFPVLLLGSMYGVQGVGKMKSEVMPCLRRERVSY